MYVSLIATFNLKLQNFDKTKSKSTLIKKYLIISYKVKKKIGANHEKFQIFTRTLKYF